MKEFSLSLALLFSCVVLLCGCGSESEPASPPGPNKNKLGELKMDFFQTIKPIPQEEVDILLSSGLKPYTKISPDKLPTLFAQLSRFYQTLYGVDAVDSPIYIFNGSRELIQLYVHEQKNFHVNEHNIFLLDVNERKLSSVYRTD